MNYYVNTFDLNDDQKQILSDMKFINSVFGLSRDETCKYFAQARDANIAHSMLTLVEFVELLMQNTDFIDKTAWSTWQPIFHAYDVAATLRNNIADITLTI